MHALLSENFELRERMEALESEARKVEAEKIELKQKVKILLEELNNSDRLVETIRQS